MSGKALALVVVSFCSVSFAQNTQPSPQPVNAIDVINTMEANGAKEGFRRNHAKGLCVEGTFKPTKEASRLSVSNIFAGPVVDVVGRFSNPGPNPSSNDNAPMPRGFAMQLRPQKGSVSNITMLNVPVFSVSTPEAFLELLKAKTPEQVAAFKAKHLESAGFFAFMADHAVPKSYTTADYHSLHAFKFTDKKGKEQYVRWNFVSQQGSHYLKPEEFKNLSPNFLSETLIKELEKGPVAWKMEAVLANKGDSLTNPTQAWNGEHKTVALGTLTINKTTGNGTGPCDMINFDPNNLAEGIASSDDPVLRFRSPAYGVSFGKRSGEKSQGK